MHTSVLQHNMLRHRPVLHGRPRDDIHLRVYPRREHRGECLVLAFPVVAPELPTNTHFTLMSR